jgi:peptidoglycan/xylan/chitin deacetylase (PgdA/CDA1 family)
MVRQAPLLVAITFDDALSSVFDNALPELERYGFPCTIFVPSGKLGRFPDWIMEEQTDRDDPVVNAERLVSVVGPLVAVGAHGVNHVHMGQLSPDIARAEIQQSRLELEKLTGQPVLSLSFPYGDYNEELVTICRDEGLQKVFLICPESIDPTRDTLIRGRVAVGPNDWPIEFYLKISGAYTWMASASILKRRLRAKFSEGRRRAFAIAKRGGDADRQWPGAHHGP